MNEILTTKEVAEELRCSRTQVYRLLNVTRKEKKRPVTSDNPKITPSVENVPSGFLRLPTVLAFYPISRSTCWEGIAQGRYPRPVKLGPRAVGWRVEDIGSLVEQAK